MQHQNISIIIVSYNVENFLALTLDSVHKAIQDIAAEVIVVDNNSTDNSCNMVKTMFPNVILIENKDNAGFSKANNQAIEISKGEYIHFLNPDTVIPEDFYLKTLKFLNENPKIGSLGPRIIDGRGIYAPDSKKSFPSFWISVYKVTGLSSLFKNSTVFNKYYAAHISEHETAEVDILSGSCLLVRKTALEKAGGGFDESYFMYCEDVDLCHRIKLSGYKNYYFPQTTIIHYKGESTKKLTYKYMKVFYSAHALFVKKYYPKNLGILYNTALRLVLALRNIFNFGKHIFSLFKLSLLDTILLGIVFILIKIFWFESVVQITTLETALFLKTIPIFIIIWLISLFLNGAYDKPFSLYKAGRGMIIGTLIVLATYALFPIEYRFSRGVVLLSGMAGTIVILSSRWILAKMKWIRLVPRGKLDYKSAIIASKKDYVDTVSVFNENGSQSNIIGRVAVRDTIEYQDNIGTYENIKTIHQLYNIDEFTFNSNSLSYKMIFKTMESGAPNLFFTIHLPSQNALIGSHYNKYHIEEFSLHQKFIIGRTDSIRNKRLLDITLAFVFFFLYPILSFKISNKRIFFSHITDVIKGKKTWIGYSAHNKELYNLPNLKKPVLPPYKIIPDYDVSDFDKNLLAFIYASNYSALDDIKLIITNFKYIGQ